jgi:hypothetical protein
MDEEQKPDAPPLDSLSSWLSEQLKRWKDARLVQEEEFTEAYLDRERIAREGDVKGSGQAKTKKTKKLFVGSTRSMIRSRRAQILDIMFGGGRMPFDVRSRKKGEQWAKLGECVRDILIWQFTDMNIHGTMAKGVNCLCTYGTSHLTGPFVEDAELANTSMRQDDTAGRWQIIDEKIQYKRPYFAYASIWDTYPDPVSTNESDGLGNFWVTYPRTEQLARLQSNPNYRNVKQALANRKQIQVNEGSNIPKSYRANLNPAIVDDTRAEFSRYYGMIPKRFLLEWAANGRPLTDQAVSDMDVMVEAVVFSINGVVVNVGLMENIGYQRRPIYRCVFEGSEEEYYGVGIAKNNEPHQKVTNGTFRVFTEGKGLSMLGMFAVDRHKFRNGAKFKISPGFVGDFIDGLTPEDKRTAIQQFKFEDVTRGATELLSVSQQMAQEDSGVTKYNMGTDASHLNDTATGISLILKQANLPLREVMLHIDEQWIIPMIEALIEWNLKNLKPEVVEAVFDEEKAAYWAMIQELGNVDFLQFEAIGTTTYLAKEVLFNKLTGFLGIIGTSPELASYVKLETLIREIWRASEIGKADIVLSDEEIAKMRESRAKERERMEMMQWALENKKVDVPAQIKMEKIDADREKTGAKTALEALKLNNEKDKRQAEEGEE